MSGQHLSNIRHSVFILDCFLSPMEAVVPIATFSLGIAVSLLIVSTSYLLWSRWRNSSEPCQKPSPFKHLGLRRVEKESREPQSSLLYVQNGSLEIDWIRRNSAIQPFLSDVGVSTCRLDHTSHVLFRIALHAPRYAYIRCGGEYHTLLQRTSQAQPACNNGGGQAATPFTSVSS